MAPTTILVTGGTGGIGERTAHRLADTGARVLVVGRDGDRAAAAVRRLRTATGNPEVHGHTADLTRPTEARRLAALVADRHGGLDVLINNAATNVLAPFVLAHALLPLLRRSPDGRVVNLTGGIPRGRIDPDNLCGQRRAVGWTFSQYNHSKLALMAMSLRLADRFAADRVTVNVAYPGHAYTPGNRAMPATAFPHLYRPVGPLLRLLGPRLLGDRSVAAAARSSVALATDPELAGVTGIYIGPDCRRRSWPAGARSAAAQRAVWRTCRRLDGGAEHTD